MLMGSAWKLEGVTQMLVGITWKLVDITQMLMGITQRRKGLSFEGRLSSLRASLWGSKGSC